MATGALVVMIYAGYIFSGSPVRSVMYIEKMHGMKIAVGVWTSARVLRAIAGWYESSLFYGMVIGL